MGARFAFTAQSWGENAVVCRAVEERPGPVVEQQFGEFPNWTQAHSFAARLNEGLNLDPLEVRQIVTSSLLATASVLEEARKTRREWSKIAVETRAVQLRFLIAELNLALTFCRTASSQSGHCLNRTLLYAQGALDHSTQLLECYGGEEPALEEIADRAQALEATLRSVTVPTWVGFHP